MRSSKDLAKRLRFDHYPAGDWFRRHYFLAGAAVAGIGLAIWFAFTAAFGPRQYLPGPVSQNHATFGDKCEKCHDAFRVIQDQKCLECHPAREHFAKFEVRETRCGDCHVEHRPADVFLSVSARNCVDCHGGLQTKRQPALLQTSIKTFAEHPVFTPLREGKADDAQIRFNHKIHLTSDKIVRETVGPSGKLQCADCHVIDTTGRLMQPILFETHCKRCHEQKGMTNVPGIEAPHKAPEIVHDAVSAQLALVGIQNAEEIFKGRELPIPGVPVRPPLSQAASLQKYLPEELEKIEAKLYEPFANQAPLLEHNKYCFLCHVQDGTRAPGEPAKLKESKIPKRWLQRSDFTHRKHDMMACKTCHGTADNSALTTDVNLPRKEICQDCHTDGTTQSAGTNCMLCHLYHDTSKSLDIRASKSKEISIETLKGR